jgi:hypothetical protein
MARKTLCACRCLGKGGRVEMLLGRRILLSVSLSPAGRCSQPLGPRIEPYSLGRKEVDQLCSMSDRPRGVSTGIKCFSLLQPFEINFIGTQRALTQGHGGSYPPLRWLLMRMAC